MNESLNIKCNRSLTFAAPILFIRSTHIDPTYNPDDDIAQQYQQMMDNSWDQQISSIEDGTSELNYNTYASGSASLNREPRALASDMQQVQNTGHGWEDWISQEL